MAEIKDLNTTDANNIARFGEGQSIPSLNNGARALEGMIARRDRDTTAYTISTGTGGAYAILTNAAYPDHAQGNVHVFRAHVVCDDAPTLTVNALASKLLVRQGGDSIMKGDIRVNQIVYALYNASLDKFECIGISGLPRSLFADLPSGSEGQQIYVTDGRKNGEGAGLGTGVVAFHDGSNWIAVDTGATVAA